MINFNITDWYYLSAEGLNTSLTHPNIHIGQPDVTNIPAMKRRRMPRSAKYVNNTLQRFNQTNAPLIYATYNSELARTLDIIRSFDDEVSPAQFSLSVHNAVPGLLSVINGNKSLYSVLDSLSGAIESAIIEATTMLDEYESVMVIYYDDSWPETYQNLISDLSKMQVIGLVISQGDGYQLTLEEHQIHLDARSPKLSHFEFVPNIIQFLSGKVNVINNLYPRTSWRWARK